jgi:hypothetical protein
VSEISLEAYRKIQAEKQGRPKPNKYHAQKLGGYDSAKEYRRARDLHVAQRAGLISELREQVTFDLIPSQRDAAGVVVERPCRYVADFVYRDAQGNLVVEDTKGLRTREYIIKRKLMLWVHGIRISEI